jgi:ribonuclease HI
MKLYQGIELTTSHNEVSNNLSVNISTFPLALSNLKPYRNNKIIDKTFIIENIDMKNPESVKSAQKNISEKLSEITKNNPQSFKAFSSEQSFEHFTFLKSGFNHEQIIFHGNHVKKQNTQRINPQRNSSFEREKIPSISNDCLYIDFFTHHERNSKAYEVKIAGYENNNDIRSEKNPIFNSQFVLHEANTNFDEDFAEILHKHVTSPTNDGKDIAIRADSKSSHIISALNKRLKEEGLKTAHHFVAIKPNQKTINRSEQFILNAVIKKHNKLDDLSDKNVVFCDGSYMEDIPEPLISGAFILRSSDLLKDHKNVEVQVPNNATKNSNSSEILALKNALEYVATNNLTEKPLHIVFDSNYVAKRLKSIKNGTFDALEETKHTPYLNEVKDILEKSGIELEIHIVKSHQTNVHGSKKTNVVKYNEEVDELTRKGIRQFMHSENTNNRSFNFK